MMLGYSEEQLSGFFLSWGIGAFILYMVFIIGQLAWKSKAGKFGTFVMFLGLGVGFIGYVAKVAIQWWMER
ncbi:MAG: DUF2788 domain-containing protein [Comamonadaceae bacterium]|nr:MAG: DUF2788 domain-containing protein [Comamonadaceae bacterium]